MSDVNTLNDVQAPVVEAPEETVSSEQTDLTPRPQSFEQNAAFKKLRLENQRLREENEAFSARALQWQMEKDLSAIRDMDPTVNSLEELGDEFCTLVAAGIDAPVAFAAIRQRQQAQLPPAMGAVENVGSTPKEFYLPEEVDALSSKQLSDPAIWQKVRASMTKW